MRSPASMEQEEVVNGVSRSVAVLACAAMAIFYVAILYAPALLLRLPPPTSYSSFMIRRFICAAISSVVSFIASALILSIRWNSPEGLSAYGIRSDHNWQALIFPLSLTSLIYAGSFIVKFLRFLDSYKEHQSFCRNKFVDYIISLPQRVSEWMLAMVTNISAWRNYVVAPLTEELVFRACMIPLLLCGGFSAYTAVFLCPIFFSLAHLNHFWELYTKKNRNFVKASMAVGFQLGYTVVFGSYASFLFVRTGHLSGPLISHIFCNYMGIPVIFSRRTGLVTLAFIVGLLGFIWLLFPLTSPHLFNYKTDTCKCWHGYCNWD
ncbi:hypothetical protein M9H77_24099 [Catharanthus roseus]|uniref:Uncharacterized protein n=1 Tax=Catharanthus roseus TaxID=4058 RepID=A0ACC0AW54_CATRO|nr:hypothetical protein M9H77_24099 [Catharanthus roseus]